MTRIGRSDLDILPLSLGGNVFGWTADRDTSFAVLDAFHAGGGDFIDTADGYSAWAPGNSGGESETLIGEWLASRKPENVVVATKVSTHPDFRGLSARTVRTAAEASLRRLGVDRIDLYYAHFDDAETPLEETVAAFADLVTDGLVRYVAVSNYTAARIREWISLAEAAGADLPVAVQPHYNLVHRTEVEADIVPVAEQYGMSLVPYYALASGFLTGKYRTTDATGDSPSRRGRREAGHPRRPRASSTPSKRWATPTAPRSPRRRSHGCARSRRWRRRSPARRRWSRSPICSPERASSSAPTRSPT